jgi:hypothetical protein
LLALLQDWSHEHRGRGAEPAFVARLIAGTGRLSTVTAHFAPEEVDAMKAAATAELLGTGRWVSGNDAFTAHLWQVRGALLRPGAAGEPRAPQLPAQWWWPPPASCGAGGGPLSNTGPGAAWWCPWCPWCPS